ncbi:MAG: AEC family transporter [Nevskia sp.]|nr:AEC family transporter [Nevskia sp.]
MSALLLLLVCLALGVLVARFAAPPADMARGINWWVINIALPALVLRLIPQTHFEPQLWFLVASMWLVFGGSWLLFGWLGRRLGWGRSRTGAMVLVCGLGATSFIGFPMIEALRGAPGLQYAIIADQLGCYTALAAGGIAVTAVYAGHRVLPSHVVRRILASPPIWALAGGVAVGLLGPMPAAPAYVLERLGQSMGPLALFSVGLQFRLHAARGQLGLVALGLGWKMALAPLACYLLAVATGVGGLVLATGVLQAAAAPMVSGVILAQQYELEPPLAASLLGAGILVSLLWLPLLNLAL